MNLDATDAEIAQCDARSRQAAYFRPSWTTFQSIMDGISDERGRFFRLIVDDVSA
jgi:hypothetical protein